MSISVSHAAADSYQCECNVDLAGQLLLGLVVRNSAIGAPYQNRNDAAFWLTAGVASSITRSIAERRSDCATQGDRQSVVLSPAQAQKFECRAEGSSFGHSDSRLVGDR